jgi:hypothetical protein
MSFLNLCYYVVVTVTFNFQVKDVIFEELQAVADIVAVQDDISLPEQHEIPLTCLYPTEKQENEILDIHGTANCLDQLR